MKKILMLAPALALALVVASSAEASSRYRMDHDDTLSVNNRNSAVIISATDATSDSGNNVGAGDIETGRADSMATSRVDANYNETVVTAPCDCYDDLSVRNENRAFVKQDTSATSDTGDNRSVGSVRSGRFGDWHSTVGTITSGESISTAESITMVNSNVTRIR